MRTLLNSPDNYGNVCLHLAIKHGHKEVRISTIARELKAGVNVKAALTSHNTAFRILPISLSHFKRNYISMLIPLTTIWRFRVNFWVIFGHFGKEIFFLKG